MYFHLFLSNLSFTKKFCMLICLEFPVHEFPPFTFILIALWLSWNAKFIFTTYYCPSMTINETYLLVPSVSAFVEPFVFSFCLIDQKYTFLCPKYIVIPVWLFILSYTANTASTNTKNAYNIFAPIILTLLMIFHKIN